MDEGEVAYALELVDSFLEAALRYDREDPRSDDLVTVLLTVAHETSVEVFGFDASLARLEKDMPRDWRYRWPAWRDDETD